MRASNVAEADWDTRIIYEAGRVAVLRQARDKAVQLAKRRSIIHLAACLYVFFAPILHDYPMIDVTIRSGTILSLLVGVIASCRQAWKLDVRIKGGEQFLKEQGYKLIGSGDGEALLVHASDVALCRVMM